MWEREIRPRWCVTFLSTERRAGRPAPARDRAQSHLLAVVTPNLPAKPDTLLFNKVTIKGAKQAVQMFGPAQAAVARAVVDSVNEGVISKSQANDLCILVGVFIHWQAEDDKKIYQYNYQATKESIARALKGEPSAQTVLDGAAEARHPFAGGAEG